MDIKHVLHDKKKHLDLLLLGDEQESMIDRYIDLSKMIAGSVDGSYMAICAYLEVAPGIIEIKNLAVAPEYQRKGYGRALLQYVEATHPGHTIILGTGEAPSTLNFYKACGYSFSHRLPDFFTKNYDHPIIEEGVTLKDMIYLKKET